MAVFARRTVTDGRRRFVRVPLGVPVEISGESDDFLFAVVAVGRDISLGGIFVDTDIPYLFGEHVLIYLALPHDARSMSLPATVRWTCPSGIGLQFGLLGARDTHDITEFTFQSRAT